MAAGTHDSKRSKVRPIHEVAALFRDGDSIIVSGFYDFGRPLTLLRAVHDAGIRDIDLVTNDIATPGEGAAPLVVDGRVRSVTMTFVGSFRDTNTKLKDLTDSGRMTISFVPQGTLIERIRAAGAGIAGFYTPTGVGTEVAEGKEAREIGGRRCLLETALTAKFGLVKAWRADRMGNLQFRGTERNFNIAIAKACEVTIAEAEVITDAPLDPECVHVPHNFVDHVVQSGMGPKGVFGGQASAPSDPAEELIARRAALELSDGEVVNLGVGIPTLVVNYIPEGMKIWLQSESGVLGMGPVPSKREDILPSVIDAGRKYVTVNGYGAFFDSTDSFTMIRGGHIDTAVLGALEVDQHGNLANWKIPGNVGPGMGGGMDLATGARRLIIATRHASKLGPKVKKRCTLPLTTVGSVDLIITEMAVFEVDHAREGAPLILREVAPGVSVQDVLGATGADVDTAHVKEWRT